VVTSRVVHQSRLLTYALLPPPAAGAEGQGMDLHIAVANGLGNAKKLVKQLQEGNAKYDFIEVSS
jgi:hypothetical protein